ncbi:hypothetical protein BBJ28_00001471 [Nothophytophthora sp. Chile5]|nr:hypothetical protein BBJ28_00001471 [Nothophytophthora sp. Chile5]
MRRLWAFGSPLTKQLKDHVELPIMSIVIDCTTDSSDLLDDFLCRCGDCPSYKRIALAVASSRVYWHTERQKQDITELVQAFSTYNEVLGYRSSMLAAAHKCLRLLNGDVDLAFQAFVALSENASCLFSCFATTFLDKLAVKRSQLREGGSPDILAVVHSFLQSLGGSVSGTSCLSPTKSKSSFELSAWFQEPEWTAELNALLNQCVFASGYDFAAASTLFCAQATKLRLWM